MKKINYDYTKGVPKIYATTSVSLLSYFDCHIKNRMTECETLYKNPELVSDMGPVMGSPFSPDFLMRVDSDFKYGLYL